MSKKESKVSKRLLTTKEAAEYLNLSPNYIRELVAMQEIPYRNISRGDKACYRFVQCELDEWSEKLPGIRPDEL
jgi:excisionase family DNA binding protein